MWAFKDWMYAVIPWLFPAPSMHHYQAFIDNYNSIDHPAEYPSYGEGLFIAYMSIYGNNH